MGVLGGGQKVYVEKVCVLFLSLIRIAQVVGCHSESGIS